MLQCFVSSTILFLFHLLQGETNETNETSETRETSETSETGETAVTLVTPVTNLHDIMRLFALRAMFHRLVYSQSNYHTLYMRVS